MKIYLIRHAQTIDNVNQIIQGQNDSELTEIGIQQTFLLGEFLKSKKITKIISSPILRALKTAEIIKSLNDNPEIIFFDELKEINLISWEKKSKSELLHDKSSSGYFTYKQNPELFKPISGESFGDVQKRAWNGMEKIFERFKSDDSIAIVSHSITIRTILLKLENKSFEYLWEYKLPSSSVTTISVNETICNVESIGIVPYE